jgi:hypothetical protein
MKKVLFLAITLVMAFTLVACNGNNSVRNHSQQEQQPTTHSASNSPVLTDSSAPPAESEENTAADLSETTPPETPSEESEEEMSGIKIKITVGDQKLTATLIDNATTRSLISMFPLTVRMMDLYSREMCYRFPDPLPANEAQTSGYEVGDISYWTPGHSLVIFYEQNGEVISNLQKIGHINSGVEIFKETGDVDVTFELL